MLMLSEMKLKCEKRRGGDEEVEKVRLYKCK